jgi:argininosuccinate lyase
MSPPHFVQVRTTYGGPAPEETARALAMSSDALARDRAAWQGRRDRLASADSLLRERVAAL